eukprot:1260813-Prymnesium_polylepis.4
MSEEGSLICRQSFIYGILRLGVRLSTAESAVCPQTADSTRDSSSLASIVDRHRVRHCVSARMGEEGGWKRFGFSKTTEEHTAVRGRAEAQAGPVRDADQ